MNGNRARAQSQDVIAIACGSGPSSLKWPCTLPRRWLALGLGLWTGHAKGPSQRKIPVRRPVER